MNGAVWTPSPETERIGRGLQGQIPNIQGSRLTSDDLSRAQLPVQPGTRALASWVKARWGLSSVGTARGSSVQKPARLADGSLRRRDVHEEGRALDAMTANIAVGTEIAETLVSHARELGVQYVIWRRTEWSSSQIADAWEPYRGSSDHADHVHAEVTPSMAASAEAMAAAIRRVESAIADAGAATAEAAQSTGNAGAIAAVVLTGIAALFFSRREAKR